MKKFQGIFFIADRKTNTFMEAASLRESGKYYCELLNVVFKTNKKINKSYIMTIINSSFDKEENFMIAAILHKNKLYSHDSVKIISDGKNGFWVEK